MLFPGLLSKCEIFPALSIEYLNYSDISQTKTETATPSGWCKDKNSYIFRVQLLAVFILDCNGSSNGNVKAFCGKYELSIGRVGVRSGCLCTSSVCFPFIWHFLPPKPRFFTFSHLFCRSDDKIISFLWLSQSSRLMVGIIWTFND